MSGTILASTINPGAASALTLQSANTTALTIDTSQNVGIGTSSPTTKLQVAGVIYSSGSNGIAVGDGTSFTPSGLNSIPNYGFGYTTTGAITSISGFGAINFYTNQVERMRVDQNGNLLVGTTSVPSPGGVSGQGIIANNAANNGAWVGTFQSAGSSNNRGVAISYSAATPNDGFNEAIYFRDSTAARFIVKSNGGINNYSANNTNLSDERLKKDIQPAGLYLDKICAIPVKTFLYKDQTDGDINLGVIAQDVLAVAPEFVDKNGWGEKAPDGSNYLSIYETDLQYALMKCIQELKAEFDAYKASHP